MQRALRGSGTVAGRPVTVRDFRQQTGPAGLSVVSSTERVRALRGDLRCHGGMPHGHATLAMFAACKLLLLLLLQRWSRRAAA